ncbi:MAG: hypothetical protein CM1200mP9_04340 [Gammaproteobacteria bacterium]|nr:MAG: hypothetical protein CM1200mP9_04340 [Gammaproteobacteria bacterium]
MNESLRSVEPSLTPYAVLFPKGKGITNVTGEKLYESQVIDAMTAAKSHFEITYVLSSAS